MQIRNVSKSIPGSRNSTGSSFVRPIISLRRVRHAGTHHANRHGVLFEKLLISMISHIPLRMASTCYACVVLSCHIRDPRHPAERMRHHAIRNTTAWLFFVRPIKRQQRSAAAQAGTRLCVVVCKMDCWSGIGCCGSARQRRCTPPLSPGAGGRRSSRAQSLVETIVSARQRRSTPPLSPGTGGRR